MAKRVKPVTREVSLADAASEAIGDLTGLGEELREICDNTPDSLQSTSLYETRDSTASECESISEPDYPSELSDVKVTITDLPRYKRGPSRANRAGQASYILQTCVDALDDLIDKIDKIEGDKTEVDQQRHDAAETLRDDLQNIIDTADNLEWPGMYG